MTPRRSWLDQSTDVFFAELGNFDLVASRARVSDLIRQRVDALVTGLDITEQSARRYLSEDALRELARGAAVTLADEQPGAQLLAQPRTIPMSPQVLGRSVVALTD